MIILVTGGRDYANAKAVDNVLSLYLSRSDILIHGGARGADTLCRVWCEEHGVHHAAVPALWDWYTTQGNMRRAGVDRNSAMLWLKPEMLIVFPGGRGTNDMHGKAFNSGLRNTVIVTA